MSESNNGGTTNEETQHSEAEESSNNSLSSSSLLTDNNLLKKRSLSESNEDGSSYDKKTKVLDSTNDEHLQKYEENRINQIVDREIKCESFREEDINSDELSKAYMNSGDVSNFNTSSFLTSVSTPDGEVIEVSPDKVGQIIGSKGAIIQDMQSRTGAKIYVNQNFPDGVNRQVIISGTNQQIKAATDLVKRIINEGPTAIHVNSLTGGPNIQVCIECPQALVGRVIGAGGATIKELQARSGAKIQIDQNFPEGQARKINISGTQAAVSIATQLVSYVMEHGPALPPSPTPTLYGSTLTNNLSTNQSLSSTASILSFSGIGNNSTQIIECPKSLVGKIIGRSGETINLLQAKSGAKVQIDQNVPVGQPCKVIITGSAQSILMASQLVQELILNIQGRLNSSQGQSVQSNNYGMQQQQFSNFPPSFGVPQQQQPLLQSQFGFPTTSPQQQQLQQFQMQQQYAQAYAGMNVNPSVSSFQSQNVMHHQQHQSHQQQQAYVSNPTSYQQSSSSLGAGPSNKASLPSTWSEHKTDDGNTYWYNSATGVSQWERPTTV